MSTEKNVSILRLRYFPFFIRERPESGSVRVKMVNIYESATKRRAAPSLLTMRRRW